MHVYTKIKQLDTRDQQGELVRESTYRHRVTGARLTLHERCGEVCLTPETIDCLSDTSVWGVEWHKSKKF